MSDDLDDYADAIADAHEAGDHERAHELIAEQRGDGDKPEPTAPQDLGPSDLIPVADTSAVYEHVRAEFGEDEAYLLQRAWGDSAVSQDRIVAAMLEDDKGIGTIYESFQTEAGGLSREGVEAAYQHLLDNSDYDTGRALDRAHPELGALYHDYADESGAIGPAGVKIILAHVAGKTGYKAAYRAKR